MWWIFSIRLTQQGCPCMRIHCKDVNDFLSTCTLYCLSSGCLDKGVYHSSASPHFSDLSTLLSQPLIAFSRCNQRLLFYMGLATSVGFCVLVNLMSAGNMVCLRDDVAGSISQNTLGIFSIPEPLSEWEYPACISPSNVATAACRSCLRRQLSPYLMR